MSADPYLEQRHQRAARDGWRLDVLELRPPEPVACVIAGHAMMVDRRTLYRADRPTLGSALAAAGVQVLLPDLRGHGHSGPTPREGGRWSYAELVDDVGVYLDLARELAPARPVFVLGHSLFGHLSLAHLGQRPEAVEALRGLVLLAVNVWNRRWNHGVSRWAFKRASMAAATAIVRAQGYYPSRRLRMGTADESRDYWLALNDCVTRNRWVGAGGVDHAANLARIGCPALHVLSHGDRWYADPEDSLAFSSALPRREVLVTGSATRFPDLRPNHMGLATDPRSAPIWAAIVDWIRAQAGG